VHLQGKPQLLLFHQYLALQIVYRVRHSLGMCRFRRLSLLAV
jgi:hypothetical protein